MADSDFWRDLAVQFGEIPTPWTLRADRDYIISTGGAGRWNLLGSPNSVAQFEALARRGASKIPNTASHDLLISWLEALMTHGNSGFQQGPYAIEKNDDVTDGPHHLTGSIYRLHEASANFCTALESDALQAEFEEKRRNDPRNWSQIRQHYEAFKEIKKLITGPHETIPEALVRTAIAQQYLIKPEEVTWQQIRIAVADLLRDYPAITLIPTEQAPSQPTSESTSDTAEKQETERRAKLLAEYKVTTKTPSNKRLYEARNSGIHKPEFYEWLNGTLPTDSATTITFERFLREKKPPIPRKPKG